MKKVQKIRKKPSKSCFAGCSALAPLANHPETNQGGSYRSKKVQEKPLKHIYLKGFIW